MNRFLQQRLCRPERSGKIYLNSWEKKTCQPKIPYPEKITFKDKDVSDKQNDPHTSTTRYAKEIS